MSYIEKKTIKGKVYYYLTKNVRIGKNKWKKVRKYLGTKPIVSKKKPKKPKIKTKLSKQQVKIIEQIRYNYSKKYKVSKALWKTQREGLVNFIFNTNAIEGNTLTYDETDRILQGKSVPVKGRKRDVKEVKNMKKCLDFLFDYKDEIDEKMVLKLHFVEMGGILPDAGKYRKVNVRVGTYLPPLFSEVLKKMREFFKWYNSAKDILNPFELAALVHLKFVRIHPFSDGNGRMSRFLMNFILMKHGYPLLNIFDAEKMLYYLVLRKVDATKREKPFVDYLFTVYLNQYKKFV